MTVKFSGVIYRKGAMCMDIYCVFVFLLVVIIIAEGNEVTESDIVNYMMVSHSAKYWKTRPPGFQDSVDIPVTVQVQLYLQRIEKIDHRGEILFQMIHRMSWIDTRLNFSTNVDANNFWETSNSSEYVIIKDTSKIWVPDTVISNETEEREFSSMAPKAFIQLYRNGTILYSQKLQTVSNCQMRLQLFPFDKIVCDIKLTAYSDTVKHMQLKWADSNPVKFSQHFPHVPLLLLEEYEYTTEVPQTLTREHLEQYSSISIRFQLCRTFRFYFLKYYLPVWIILLISWTQFWLGRVLILRIYTAMSTIIFLAWYYISQPNEVLVPYLTALDVWRGINFVFILLAAYESVFITYMIKTNTPKVKRTHPDENEKYKMLPCKDCPQKKKYLEETEAEKTDLDLELLKLKANFKICFINVAKEVEIIDSVAKLFFPSAYVIFIFFYCLKCHDNNLF